MARELDHAHQAMANANREAYLRLLLAQGQARLDSAHSDCAMRLLEAANLNLPLKGILRREYSSYCRFFVRFAL